ncbi:reverse transcriptase/maturase family protein [Patescibacteria group bacterium]|nr:reverse transcriptase/maturase family protein [Patescibacteria group bacterium]
MKKAKKLFAGSFDSITTMENILIAWRAFKRGKTKKLDVQEFERNLIVNLLSLHTDLQNGTYRHGGYQAFKINDPKPRDIHKALVRDRVVHHLLYLSLAPFFFQIFVTDSYSCQLGKGTHKALNRFREFSNIVAKNNTKPCFVLKCDIRKFFASIDHEILQSILEMRLNDKRLLALIRVVVESFNSGVEGKGLPLGNLTSQLLVNIYMHEFDMYIKQTLKIPYYIRYADDFVIFSADKDELLKTLSYMIVFLGDTLRLTMHPDKVAISILASGVDFLGWVHFPNQRVLRTVTKKRLFRKLASSNFDQTVVQSYFGLLQHGDTYKLLMEIRDSLQDNHN